MDATKMVFGIDILDYDHMDIKDSHKWLIETRFSTQELDEIASDLINKKGKFAKVSAASLASEMEHMNCIRILEDLTGIIQHTSEYEL
ncbi:MAG: hypothetical protein PHN32_04495 [Actinomycetota bacterium]|jgi:hypothetical protein|nr:hypothetical protein [Actinomycetota bacterium]